MSGHFHFERFIEAQDRVYNQVLKELNAGYKQTHWMWFIFPQLAGLGTSEIARLYAISSLNEACDYLNHPILGLRLRECTKAVNEVRGRNARQIFGSPDDLKFCSSMTLFHQADPSAKDFQTALQNYYHGKQDKRTLDLLNRG